MFSSSTPTPSQVEFHLVGEGSSDLMDHAAGGVESNVTVTVAGVPGTSAATHNETNNNQTMTNGESAATVNNVAVLNPQVAVTIKDTNKKVVTIGAAPTIGAVNGGNAPTGPAPGRSVSHWHDSRISVEMHLALYIEDLMLLAPGASAEKAKSEEQHHASEFDEDAEPDITLQHVLAGVEYLLKTRIIGNAVGGPTQDIDEGDEEEDEKKAGEASVDAGAVTDVEPDADLDDKALPAPLVKAPAAVVNEALTSASDQVQFPPSSLASPYFYFVSLDLALCDDLVTALCFHMRRTEKSWSLRPKSTPEALKALELFEGFFTYVYSFRCAVAARPSTYLFASLKIGRYLRATDSAHRRLAVRLLVLLTKECPRIEKWEDLVDADDQPKVREMMNTREIRSLQRRLNNEHRGPNGEREESLSRMSSFRTSRETKPTDVGGVGVGTSGSDAASNFPKFFSTKHNKLLPPKGACFDVEPKRLLQMFHTDLKKGLTKDEIAERQGMYGKNVLPPPHEASFLRLLWDQIKDFIILVLLAAAIVSAAIEDWEAAGVLLAVVIINVIIGLVQEYRSANALKALNSFAIPQAQLLRDGEVSVEPASELVPGDIVILEEGANIPADLRLLEVSQLSTIEAILTGESLPILKSTSAIKPRGKRFLPVGDRVNMAFMSTLVSKGRAVGLVVNTGATTEVGRIYSALAASAAESTITPLQRKLATLGKWLVLVSVLACGAVIGIGLGRDYGSDIIKIGISLAVSVIPEGLVTVVTLTMAIGTQRMAKKKAIARNLPAVETLGSLTTICSDKTGTLTEGKMKTETMWAVTKGPNSQAAHGHTLRFITASKVVNKQATNAAVNGEVVPEVVVAPVEPAGQPSSVSVVLDDTLTVRSSNELPVPLLWNNLNCSLNNNASVKMQDVINKDGSVTQEEVLVGDATEIALLRATQQSGCGVNYWTENYAGGLKRSLEFAFDSDRKRMSVILELPPPSSSSNDDEFVGVVRPAGMTHLLLVKGAPEAVLNKSVSFLSSASGRLASTPLTDETEGDIEAQGSLMASKGMRVLATAFRYLTQAQVDKFIADLAAANAAAEAGAGQQSANAGPSGADLISFDAECELTFIGLNGIMDPPRVEVADAIAMAHVAGIRVCMITGDHFDTALAIARQIGIYSDARGDRAMNGDALAVLSEEQLSNLNPFPVVFSRVSPENKLKLVKSLQRRGEICAMTGDGVNDSPAIKQADVGIAMGLAGTEVTRQAADIILSDDNFSTIVSSVGEGRRIYDNIVKFLVYLLTCNGAEVWVMLFAVILAMPVPFLSLMLLWANIFADIPPSLSLGLEEGEADTMERPPRPAEQNILTLRVGFIIAFDSAWMAIMVLINYYHCYEIRDEHIGYAQTFAFELLACLHLIHSFQARSLTDTMFHRNMFTSNPALVFSLMLSVGFLVAGCYLPGLNDVLELEPLNGLEWGVIAINLVVHVIVIEGRKFVMRRYEANQMAKIRASQTFGLAAKSSGAAAAAPEEIELVKTVVPSIQTQPTAVSAQPATVVPAAAEEPVDVPTVHIHLEPEATTA